METRNNIIPPALKKAILYSDIFSFPLRKDEIYRYMVISHAVSKKKFESIFSAFEKKLYRKNGYYALSQRTISKATKRREREEESTKKIQQALSALRFLKYIPTIHFIGISGTVAFQSARRDDDIDLFVITKSGTLWTTRFLLLMILELMGKRRRYGQAHTENLFCVNMLLDESALSFPDERHDIYTAHEIVRMIPIFSRNDTYKEFLMNNQWVKRLLYPAYKEALVSKPIIEPQKHYVKASLSAVFSIIEPLLRVAQSIYLRRHRTIETVTKNTLAFHPNDYRQKVLTEYEKRLVK